MEDWTDYVDDYPYVQINMMDNKEIEYNNTRKKSKNMKKIIILAFALITLKVGAQTLADNRLEQVVRQTLVDGLDKYGEDVSRAGVVIMEAKTGNVIANVSVGHVQHQLVDIPNGNQEPIPSGISRAVLYLSMVGQLSPDFTINTGDGLYIDTITGCTIADSNYQRGGYGVLTLKKAFDLSDVGIIKAAEYAFGRDMMKYGTAIRKTGLFKQTDDFDYSDTDSLLRWMPCDILNKSPFSILQQTAWSNLIADGGRLMIRLNKEDPTTPICEVKLDELDSLRSAMLEAVEHGTGKKMKSKHIQVAGMTNTADVVDYKSYFATAFFPYENPEYTIGIFVNKQGAPAMMSVTKIVGQLIDYMVENQHKLAKYKNRNIDYGVEFPQRKYHPAEK